ncbi:MAG: hypothetical protein GOVbin406_12 [Prokaryotic dsDNA virus sp.]|nr:MAG: hypothetical protein GOVbin406_12 [Prokaryotic dsDNA virus sp.]|tara:strand:- start:16849 stop:17112 length:264 start_codon:yes stop_codon:yes gene_type:complete
MKKLSQKTYKEMALRGKLTCPACGGQDCVYNTQQPDRACDTWIEHEAHCEDCGTHFVEKFRLAGYEIKKTKKEVREFITALSNEVKL